MTGRPEVLFRPRAGRNKVSVILLDWNVRESFHSIDYLNRQTAARDDYELIWVEFYGRRPEAIRQMVESPGRPKLDQWLLLGYPTDLVYHKHRAYNAGLAAARGDICVICDSDAMFRPTFIESVIRAFDDPEISAIHLDQVRNFDKKYYPFNYPSFEEVMGAGAVNWNGKTTLGLATEHDRLHRANYGACLAARRSDLLAIGGSDEHLDYLGYCCGPYDLTFRLLNRGGKERWLEHEFLYHTWHPNQTSINTDYSGPHDGRFMTLLALHARATGRVRPYLELPCLAEPDDEARFQAMLGHISEHPEPHWRADNLPAKPTDFVYTVEKNYRGHDIHMYRDEWYACPTGQPFDASRPDLLRGESEMVIRGRVISEQPRRPRARAMVAPNLHFAEAEAPCVGRPEVLLRSPARRKKVSVILADWNRCESFHSIDYLNRQTAARDDYELIWVEFYDRRAEPLRRLIETPGRPMLDQWLVLGYPAELTHHKHRAYNAGLAAARGDICVICDASAMVRPTFIENILRAFDETAYAAVHIDMVRNLDERFHPFRYPTFEEVIGPGSVNWLGGTTQGLWSEEDRLHRADYASCFAARRNDLLAIGGADEHAEYVGESSGPYEMSFRLVNRGRRERWLTSEYLFRTDRLETVMAERGPSGPTDGREISLRALHARTSGQVRPYLENPCMTMSGVNRLDSFLSYVAEHSEPDWLSDRVPASPDFAYLVERDFRGYDLYARQGDWYACTTGLHFDSARPDTLWGEDEESIRMQVIARSPHHPGKSRPSRVQRLVKSLLSEPLHCLPRRAWRVAGRAIKKRVRLSQRVG